MNNYTKIINQLKEKIVNFSKDISLNLSLPSQKFILNMIYGLICSSSSYLSEISRSLKEDITLKKVVERLSNNLANFDKEKRDYVWNCYIENIKNKIDENTVFCFDPGDLGKKHSKKLEDLDLIKDGSTGEYINGYKMVEVAALTKNEKLPIPVYSSLYSSKEENFISEQEEYFKFKKQQFKFEKLLVRSLDSIRALNMFLSIVIGFIAIFSDNQDYAQYMIVFKAAKSLRSNDKIVLVYYVVEKGFNKIFNYDDNRVVKLYNRKNKKSEQCILPEFSSFSYFIN